MTTAEHVRAGVRHPLEPLTAEEIETVSRILTRDRGLVTVEMVPALRARSQEHDRGGFGLARHSY